MGHSPKIYYTLNTILYFYCEYNISCVFLFPVYFPVDPKAGGSSVALMMMTSQSSRYSWKVRITQIDCLADPQAVGELMFIQSIYKYLIKINNVCIIYASLLQTVAVPKINILYKLNIMKSKISSNVKKLLHMI